MMCLPSHLPGFRALDAAFVTEQLAVGADLHHDEQHAADQLVELLNAHVTHMLDVRREWSDEAWVKRAWPRMQYLHHGIDDAGQRIGDAWFDRGVQWVGEAVDAGHVVYVHCHQGSNRSPSLVLAVLLQHYGIDVVEAIEHIATVRPHAQIAYAHDALAWHHRSSHSSESARRRDHERLEHWLTFAGLSPAIQRRRPRSNTAS